MAVYRIYWFDADERIVCGDNLIASTHAEARVIAEGMIGMAPAVEVWLGGFFVARVDADPADGR
jgi:hypothetical protein